MNESFEKNEVEEKVIVKGKSNKGIIILLVILILMVMGLSIFVVCDKIISKNDIVEEEKNNEILLSLKDNTYDLSLDASNGYYFKFINDTEYECLIPSNVDDVYASKGTYKYDGKNIKLSDKRISVILYGSMLYVNIDNYSIEEDGSMYYDIYFNRKIMKDEFSKIGMAAANTRIEEWNKNHSVKMIRTEGNVERCYKNGNDSKEFACSITIKQFFEEYDKYTCENDPYSAYQESVISSGECKDGYSTFWSFSSVDKNEDGYKVYGRWTGI